MISFKIEQVVDYFLVGYGCLGRVQHGGENRWSTLGAVLAGRVRAERQGARTLDAMYKTDSG